MKKILEGKLYNTESARMVGVGNSDIPRNDFHYFTETLYVKKTGEYFLHGEGGPASKYARSAGQNSWSGGEKIIPMSFANALQWAEENLSADEYEAAFGPISEDGTLEAISWSLPTGLVKALRLESQEAGITVGALVAQKLAQP